MKVTSQPVSTTDCNDIDISDIDFSDASTDSIYDLLIDIYGERTLSTDFLTALLASRPDCQHIDWYEYIENLLLMQTVIRMSLQEQELAQKGLLSDNVDDSCIGAQNTQPSSHLSSQNPIEFQSLKEKYGYCEAKDDGGVPLSLPVVSTPASPSTASSITIQAESPSRPNFRLASPPPTSSSSTNPQSSDSTQTPFSNEWSIATSGDQDNFSSGWDVSSQNFIPLDEQSTYSIDFLDSGSDSEQEFCMSGALPPHHVHNAHNRLQLALSTDEEEHLICSDDLNLQVRHMPYRIVSREEFERDWADVYFNRPNSTLRHLRHRFCTTPQGISHAIHVADFWGKLDFEANCRRLSTKYLLSCEDELHPRCACWPHIMDEAKISLGREEKNRLEALRYFSGEYVSYANECVKYPEQMTSYYRNSDELDDHDASVMAEEYWYSLYARGEIFWREQDAAEEEAAAYMYHQNKEKNQDHEAVMELEVGKDKNQDKQNLAILEKLEDDNHQQSLGKKDRNSLEETFHTVGTGE